MTKEEIYPARPVAPLAAEALVGLFGAGAAARALGRIREAVRTGFFAGVFVATWPVVLGVVFDVARAAVRTGTRSPG
jgi:hypothetical protein